MIRYIAFLRGINSRGNQTVRMEVLHKIFEDLGFENVKTVLASGNVLSETDPNDSKLLEHDIEKVLPGIIGFGSTVIIRSVEAIRHLASLHPFEGFTPHPNKNSMERFYRERRRRNEHLRRMEKVIRFLGFSTGLFAALLICQRQTLLT